MIPIAINEGFYEFISSRPTLEELASNLLTDLATVSPFPRSAHPTDSLLRCIAGNLLLLNGGLFRRRILRYCAHRKIDMSVHGKNLDDRDWSRPTSKILVVPRKQHQEKTTPGPHQLLSLAGTVSKAEGSAAGDCTRENKMAINVCCWPRHLCLEKCFPFFEHKF